MLGDLAHPDHLACGRIGGPDRGRAMGGDGRPGPVADVDGDVVLGIADHPGEGQVLRSALGHGGQDLVGHAVQARAVAAGRGGGGSRGGEGEEGDGGGAEGHLGPPHRAAGAAAHGLCMA